jgi:hypothetical protein
MTAILHPATSTPASALAVAAPPVDYFDTATGIQIVGKPSLETWSEFLLVLVSDYNRLKWHISDWLAYGEDAFGDDIYQFVSDHWQPQTIANYVSTARRIPHNERRADVAFSTHSEVASLSSENRKHALAMVASGEWNREDVREYKRGLKGLPQAVETTITLQYRAHKIVDGILTVQFVEPAEAYEIVGYKAIVRKRAA